MQRSRVEHTPVNDYNAKDVTTYLSRAYDEAASEAQQTKSTVVYKPSGGGWTTSSQKSASGGNNKTNAILGELSRSLRHLDGGNNGGGGGRRQSKQHDKDRNDKAQA